MVEVHPWALDEVNEAAEFYESRLRGLGQRFLDEYEHALARIDARPLTAPPYLVGDAPSGVRHVLLPSFPYAVVFITGPRTFVVAVANGRKAPRYWHERMLGRPRGPGDVGP